MTMKAVIFEKFGPPSVMHLVTDHPKPVRKPGDLLVEVAATSVNPVDFKTRKGVVRVNKGNGAIGSPLIRQRSPTFLPVLIC